METTADLAWIGLVLTAAWAVGLFARSVARQMGRDEEAAADTKRRRDEWHRCRVRKCDLACARMAADLERAAGTPLPTMP